MIWFAVQSVSKDEKKCVQAVELDNGQVLYLNQSWYHSLIEVGDRISYEDDESNQNNHDHHQLIRSAFHQNPEQLVNKIILINDSSASFMVLNPDRLITSTDLSSASFCLRKSWLSHRFKFYGYHNRSTLLGTLIHRLFQDTIGDSSLTAEVLHKKFINLIKDPFVTLSLVAMNLEEEELISDSKGYMNSMVLFNRKFSSGQAESFDENQPNLKLKINKITDIEDTVLSPKYGIKGKIDVIMDVEIQDRHTTKRQFATPFELKTGKVSFSFSHQSQLSLYAMMLDKPSRPCKFGLLAYLKEGVYMKYIKINNHIAKSLILQRNELVHHLKYAKIGPETCKNTSFCLNCEHQLDCCLLGQIYAPEKLSNFYLNIPDFVPSVLSHLRGPEVQFFQRYIDLIYLRELQSEEQLKDNCFWDKSALELEQKKRAIAKLVLRRIETSSPYEYVFERAQQFKVLGALPVDLKFSSHLDRITISIESESEDSLDKIGFVHGLIKSIDKDYVTVKLNEQISDSLLNRTFRLDIVPTNSNFSLMYSSILRLMQADEANSANLRAYIIDQRMPTFNHRWAANEIDIARKICCDLNDSQRKAIIESLNMENYLLIEGFAGTGKSKIIVAIVQILVELKQTVLICAPAVDNILLGLLERNVKFLRIGRPSRIHADLVEHSEERLIQSCKSMFELKVKYLSYNVFAGSCHSMNSHLVFGLKKINFCIISQANQVSFLESVLPIFDCEKFILLGDRQQLPPILKSDEANKAGLDETLFNILSKQKTSDPWQDNSVSLSIQYRMNKEIMRIANSCFYGDQLICANDEVANSTLNLKLSDLSNQTWLSTCLSSDIRFSVVFLDIDDDGIGLEIDILGQIVNQLVQCDFPANKTAIISFYAEQIRLLKSSISSVSDILAIDQYESKQKDIILILCVKTVENSQATDDQIFNDHRPLNFAITRAKRKVILVGGRKTLEPYKPFQRLFFYLNDYQVVKFRKICQ